mgnify:CR=1 FL=1|jgi:replicative DNA helicase|tara:strand:- start:799 stop:1245 length:447 start_codon:yes stop_codon:yes gene_type:complete
MSDDMPRLYSTGCEEAIIAGALAIDYVPDILEPEDFVDEWHRLAFESARRLTGPMLAPILANQMFLDGTLDLTGGEPWLEEVAGREHLRAISRPALDATAAALVDMAGRRLMFAEAQALIEMAVPAPQSADPESPVPEREIRITEARM